MLKILHRINDPSLLAKTPTIFGVEMDIHGWNKNLTVHHDANIKGYDIDLWLDTFNHSFSIFNIKEEGIEELVREKISLRNIDNFFLLDLSFPSLVKLVKVGERRIALRVSKYEPYKAAKHFKNKLNWIWLDVFEGIPLNKTEFDLLKEWNFKICLVSPELHGRGKDEIINFKNFINKHKIMIDAVCTKHPDMW
jgi:hypothetical protein